MKKTMYITLILICFCVNSALTQSSAEENSAIEMLKEFYTVYNITWSAPPNKKEPLAMDKKLRELRAKYCTKKLSAQLKNETLDYQDVMLGEWFYTDLKHLKTSLKVIKDNTKTNGYIVSYISPNEDPTGKPIQENVLLKITVAKEDGRFKIASVTSKR